MNDILHLSVLASSQAARPGVSNSTNIAVASIAPVRESTALYKHEVKKMSLDLLSTSRHGIAGDTTPGGIISAGQSRMSANRMNTTLHLVAQSVAGQSRSRSCGLTLAVGAQLNARPREFVH